MKKVRSISRLQAREMEKTFNPAIKALSSHVHNTGKVTDVFRGYKLPAGTYTDSSGRTWQIQAHAVLAKADFIKKDEVVPIINGSAILFRLRVFAKRVIDTFFN